VQLHGMRGDRLECVHGANLGALVPKAVRQPNAPPHARLDEANLRCLGAIELLQGGTTTPI